MAEQADVWLCAVLHNSDREEKIISIHKQTKKVINTQNETGNQAETT